MNVMIFCLQPEFNRLSNYLADGWTQNAGCLSCQKDLVSLDGLEVRFKYIITLTARV